MLDSLKLPIKTSEPLASLSLGEVQKAFDRVLTASENIRSSCIGVRFGDFEWGGPMLVQFVLGIRLSQAQLMGILGLIRRFYRKTYRSTLSFGIYPAFSRSVFS